MRNSKNTEVSNTPKVMFRRVDSVDVQDQNQKKINNFMNESSSNGNVIEVQNQEVKPEFLDKLDELVADPQFESNLKQIQKKWRSARIQLSPTRIKITQLKPGTKSMSKNDLELQRIDNESRRIAEETYRLQLKQKQLQEQKEREKEAEALQFESIQRVNRAQDLRIQYEEERKNQMLLQQTFQSRQLLYDQIKQKQEEEAQQKRQEQEIKLQKQLQRKRKQEQIRIQKQREAQQVRESESKQNQTESLKQNEQVYQYVMRIQKFWRNLIKRINLSRVRKRTLNRKNFHKYYLQHPNSFYPQF